MWIGEPGRTSLTEKRKLSYHEWAQIIELIREYKLPTSMWSKWGFTVGMTIWNTDPNEQILSIGLENLPGFEPDKQKPFDYSWEIFSALTHSEINKALVAQFKNMPSPREKGYYDY